MARHNEFGSWGEDMAVRYMQERGFEIVERNWRNGHKEIDIIAQREDTLYFVEVKTRHGEEWSAEGSITAKKRALMWRAMMSWKLQHPSPMPVLFSAIAIVVNNPLENPEVRWYENLWEM